MREYAIIGDSTCDLSKELREKYNIDYAPMNFVSPEREYVASLDWEEMSSADFYGAMRKGTRFTTTQVSVETFTQKFTEYLEKGMDLIYIGCSSRLSGSINLAYVVEKDLKEKYPDAKICCIDSLNACMGQGMILIRAAELRAEGKTIDETVQIIEETKLCFNQAAVPATLTYLKKAGRVTAGSAFFGNLIGIRPILISDKLGQNFALKKAKGAKAARQEVVNEVKEKIVNPEEQYVYVSDADDTAMADELEKALLEAVPVKGVIRGTIGPIIGASVGPGTTAVYFYGKEVTVEGAE